MRLTSVFNDGTAIPARFTCEGQNLSPPLSWNAPPPQTQSFALTCEDPDAPGGVWHHWAIYDIPAGQRSLAEHYPRSNAADGTKQARNDFQRQGYDGPCPPPGHGPHHYQFKLLALSTAHLPVNENPACRDVEAAAKPFILSSAMLVGTYER
jgi:Raf kinase inhibitor-like YbhB/YbcL family protein